MIYGPLPPCHIFFIHINQSKSNKIKGNTHHVYVSYIAAVNIFHIINGYMYHKIYNQMS